MNQRGQICEGVEMIDVQFCVIKVNPKLLFDEQCQVDQPKRVNQAP